MRHLEAEDNIIRAELDALCSPGNVLNGFAAFLPSGIKPVFTLGFVTAAICIVALGGQELVSVVGGRCEHGANEEAENLTQDQHGAEHGELPARHVLDDGPRHHDLKHASHCEVSVRSARNGEFAFFAKTLLSQLTTMNIMNNGGKFLKRKWSCQTLELGH